MAEKAAWDFVEKLDKENAFKLVVINVSYISLEKKTCK